VHDCGGVRICWREMIGRQGREIYLPEEVGRAVDDRERDELEDWRPVNIVWFLYFR
jgi:hypothetical protein